MHKMVDCGRVGKRPLCRSQINSKSARVSQTIDRKDRQPAGRGEEVVSTVLLITLTKCLKLRKPCIVQDNNALLIKTTTFKGKIATSNSFTQ